MLISLPLDFLQKKVKIHDKDVVLNKYEFELSNCVQNINPNLDIIGYDNIKDKLKSIIINPLVDKDKISNGVIFYGPPGTGKTTFSEFISKQTKIPLIKFDISYIENKYYGESSKYLKALFTLAVKLKPVIIFIDEIDGFCSSRNEYDQHHVNSLKTQFLSYYDETIKHNDVICIGATNRIDIIDKAVKRRMRLHIKIDLPNKETIIKLFEHFLKNKDLLEIIMKDYISYIIDSKFSCSDIEQLCNHINLLEKYNNLEYTEFLKNAFEDFNE